ncbi:MAG: hypothetical protein BWY28_01766 [bacterium ADurb.Bin236]|nr:MAG: hypothetical protein BWY28_01766 [bacterium ADurb.Bin236]HOY63476.1 MT-A70 family methyltransferase [bacterium]
MKVNAEFKNLIPALTKEEFDALERSILADGCRDAIVTWNDTIVDGHNRYEICERHGVAFNTVEKIFDGENEARCWIIRNQFARRNLSAYQRSVLALKLTEYLGVEAQKRKAAEMRNINEDKSKRSLYEKNPGLKEIEQSVSCEPKRAPGGKPDPIHKDSIDLYHVVQTENTVKDKHIDVLTEAAKVADMGRTTIAKVKLIEQHATPEQKELLNKGETTINTVYTNIKREESKAKNAALMERTVSKAPGKYSTIVIDPPWPMKKIVREVRPNQADFDYPTMSVDEIKSFPLSGHALDNCHLYLWTTQKFLPASFDIMNAWGFNYIFTMVWHKAGGFQPVGLPQYNCEFVLFGRKGNLDFLDTKDFFCAFNAPRREHSRKPEEFYDLIRRVSPGPRVDIFSREKHYGFDQWGNETEKFGGTT